MTAAADELARDRRLWAMPGSRWDRRVRLLKRVLPIAAGAIMVACLAWPLTARQEFSFVLSRDSVDKARERLRIEQPMYRGKDRRGRSFSITAARAPSSAQRMSGMATGRLPLSASLPAALRR